MIDDLVNRLGGWPEYFGMAEIRHGEALLEHLRRRKFVDELAFGIVIRYALHRAAFDQLTWQIKEDGAKTGGPDSGHQFLSATEQERAYHENRLAAIEQQLLGTPYARAKAKLDTQVTFDFGDPAELPPTSRDNVRPLNRFVPISRPQSA